MTDSIFHIGPRMRQRAIGGFACASLLLLGGCSVLVNWAETDDETTGPEADADQDLIDADLFSPDATPTAFCGPSLSGTLANYSFEGDQGQLLISNMVPGGPTGSSFLVNGNQFEQNPLVTSSGPDGCGNAASMPEAGSSILELKHADLISTQSLDFWVRLDALGNPPAIQGLVSKDRVMKHNGDFQVSAYRDIPNNKSYFVLRIQRATLDQAPAEGVYFLCSPEITLDQWHHVAVSATGQPVQLFVDGAIATGDVIIDPTYGSGATCGFDTGGFGANLTTFSENNNDWIVGATTGRSPNTVAENFLSGSIDELRFRSVGFTPADAEAVYGDGRALGASAFQSAPGR